MTFIQGLKSSGQHSSLWSGRGTRMASAGARASTGGLGGGAPSERPGGRALGGDQGAKPPEADEVFGLKH